MSKIVSVDELNKNRFFLILKDVCKYSNNELLYGFQNETFNVTVYAEGGIPFEYNKWYVKDEKMD